MSGCRAAPRTPALRPCDVMCLEPEALWMLAVPGCGVASAGAGAWLLPGIRAMGALSVFAVPARGRAHRGSLVGI